MRRKIINMKKYANQKSYLEFISIFKILKKTYLKLRTIVDGAPKSILEEFLLL